MITLYTWLGKTDVDNMEKDIPTPISIIATQSPNIFNKIVILANDWDEKWIPYKEWLEKRLAKSVRPYNDVSVKRVRITSPIDYPSILKVTDKWISKLSEESNELCINLSSGTPAMSVSSVLIGQGKPNTSFFQSTRDNESIKAEIPDDLGNRFFKSVAKSVVSNAVTTSSKYKTLKNMITESAVMKDVIYKAELLAPSDLPTLILGETGTGKEVLATGIHGASSRADNKFVTVNCGALPPTLVDSILFGHVKGAFTGAVKDHNGLFEQANEGTLFLDEVGELSLDVQVKLLRVLQEGEITKVGDDKTISIDVRIIAATHRNLTELIDSGTFREDLFYRIAIGIVELPALRYRENDIEKLVIELMDNIKNNSRKLRNYKSKNISEKGMKFILSQPWLGNIRELQGTLDRAFLWCKTESITDIDLEQAMLVRSKNKENTEVVMSYHDKVDITQLTDKYQKKYIEAALKASGNKKTHVANMLGFKSHQRLTDWMERLNITI